MSRAQLEAPFSHGTPEPCVTKAAQAHYSTGCIIHRLLKVTGQLQFRGESVLELRERGRHFGPWQTRLVWCGEAEVAH